MRIINYEPLMLLHYINELVCFMFVKRCPILSFTEETSIWFNKNAYDLFSELTHSCSLKLRAVLVDNIGIKDAFFHALTFTMFQNPIAKAQIFQHHYRLCICNYCFNSRCLSI